MLNNAQFKKMSHEHLHQIGNLRYVHFLVSTQSLREEIEKRFNSDQFSWEEVWCNDAAGLLKQFIRELPTPLLSFEYLEAFAQVDSKLFR